MASSKKKKAREANEDSEFCLKVVKESGGDKLDYDLLRDLEDDEEVLDGDDSDLEVEPIKKDEIKDFIKKLGILDQFKDDESEKNEKKEKKKKLLVAKDLQKTEDSNTEQATKKKSKNKYKDVQDNEVSSTTTSVTSLPSWDIKTHIKQYTARNYLLIKSGVSFFHESNERDEGDCPLEVEKQMENFASKLLQDEVAVFNKLQDRKKKSEVNWIRTVLTSGTLSDKMAALTLLVQESPLHNLSSLENLVAMAKKKGKRECMMAADTLREIFISTILPEERKLQHFSQKPLHRLAEITGGNKDSVDRTLLQWLFESKLKDIYADFLKALDVMLHDNIMATKEKALGIVHALMAAKPEQERLLLSTLVNKLGDPNYKLAAKASHFLSKLVDRHPNMKVVVVGEVDRLLYRPNVNVKAQYYCICFLNQLLLSHQEKSLASKLIATYFTFFKTFVKKKEVDTKMMSALLTGVNRAYPYAKVDHEEISQLMNTLYKIVHIVNFNTSLQALMLLYHVMDSSQSVSDRYYMALYKKLSDPGLKSSSKQAMFLNLVFRSIKKDIMERRVKAFVKRLLQVSAYQSAPFVCGVLVLLGELQKEHSYILKFHHAVQKFDDDSDDEEEHFTDLPDPDEEGNSEDDDDNDDEDDNGDDNDKEKNKPKAKLQSSWLHKDNMKGGKSHKSNSYDPYHRNPLYCHADQECMWELEKFTQHYHPSVSLFATRLLKGEVQKYPGDPLQDFTLIRFLDRFVYKNPKKREALPDISGTLSRSKFKHSQARGIQKIPINSQKYLEKGEENIPAEEKFFYKYFQQRAEQKSGKKADDDVSDEDSEAGSVGDDEFDEYLDQYESQLDGDWDLDMEGLQMDFAGAVGDKVKGKRKESDSEDSEEEDEDLSDEEVDFGEDFADQFKEFDEDNEDFDDSNDEDDFNEDNFDEEDVSFSDDDDELHALDPKETKNKKRKADKPGKAGGKKIKKGDSDISGIFASAEEFAHLMDESAGSKLDMTGSGAVSNKDKAHVKQIAWEMQREKKMMGDQRRKFNSKKHFKKGGVSPASKQQRKFKPKGGKPFVKKSSGKKNKSFGKGKKRK